MARTSGPRHPRPPLQGGFRLTDSGLTETQKLLYVIADNQLGLNSPWDQELLNQAISKASSPTVSALRLPHPQTC